MLKYLVFLLAALWMRGDVQAVASFPGAEGFGSQATGGRGGKVIHVTHMRARGVGSFYDACQDSAPRIIVFDTGGVILGHISIGHGDLTIAGQTAPGCGVTIRGSLTCSGIGNVIIRHIRVRRMVLAGDYDAIQFTGSSSMMLDHVTISWANDENVDMTTTNTATLQWCAIEAASMEGHSKGQHNYGMITGYPGSHDFSILHCLFANNQRRAPLIGTSDRDFVMDHRYNVIYNMQGGVYWHPDAVSSVNLAGNYVKTGPNTQSRVGASEYDCYIGGIASTQKVYTNDTYLDWAGGSVDPWAVRGSFGSVISGTPTHSTTPFAAPAVHPCTAEEAYDSVRLHAGCLPRDTVGRRTMTEVTSGTGTWGMLAWEKSVLADVMAGLACCSRQPDRDNDGMPDWWEASVGLNPADSTDQSADRNGDGYTNIEEYINAQADTLKTCAIEGRPVPGPAAERGSAFLPGTAEILVAPNPCPRNTPIRVSLRGPGVLSKVVFYDVRGEKVADFHSAPAGMYLLKADVSGRRLVRKVLRMD